MYLIASCQLNVLSGNIDTGDASALSSKQFDIIVYLLWVSNLTSITRIYQIVNLNLTDIQIRICGHIPQAPTLYPLSLGKSLIVTIWANVIVIV
jgi:hypothetical protein